MRLQLRNDARNDIETSGLNENFHAKYFLELNVRAGLPAIRGDFNGNAESSRTAKCERKSRASPLPQMKVKP